MHAAYDEAFRLFRLRLMEDPPTCTPEGLSGFPDGELTAAAHKRK